MRGQGGPAMSRADFMAQAGRHFDQIDSNKDGVASRDERRAFHQQHRMERGMGGERRNGPPTQDGARPQGQGPAGMGLPPQGAPR